MLPVDYASHSPQVERLRRDILAALDGITPGQARVPMVSAMTGETLAGPGQAGAAYWYDSLRAPVEFERAIRALAASGHGVFIEVSPHPVLAAAVTATLEDAGRGTPVVTGTLRRDDGGPSRLLASLAGVHVRGTAVNWPAVLGAGQQVELPTYAFLHQRYWPRQVVTAGRDRTETAAEARFWAAVESGDVQALSDALAVEERQVEHVLPALAAWRRREREESVTAAWRYRVSWVPVRMPDRGTAALPGTWLLVRPDQAVAGDLAAGLARALTACGAQAAVVEVAPGDDRAAVAARIRVALEQAGDEVVGVVSLLALAETPAPGSAVVPEGLAGTLALVQALGDAEIAAPLWAVTSGAVAAGPGEVLARPVQAQVHGLGRAAALEHPDRWGGLVDVPQAPDERDWRRVCAVLAGCGENEVAVRPSGLLARRLVRAPRPGRGGGGWAPGGTALVTGGTGAIGGHVARWLARRGTPHVVLASRSGPAAAGTAALAADLAAAGTRATVVAGDFAERSSVKALLNRISAGGPALRTVFHAAGVLDDGVLDGLDTVRMAGVLAVKAGGAALLDELTEGTELDAFVLFSSASGLLGSAGQGNYAAANAYLDALALARRARGRAATSVAWGQWAGGGLAGSAAARRRTRRGGVAEMPPDLAIQVLDQALADREAVLAVLDADWARVVSGPGGALPVLRDLPEVGRVARDGGDAVRAVGELGRRLAGLAAAEQGRVLADLVRGEAAAVLGHASAEAVEPGRAFRDLGFDSVTAVELRNRLAAVTGLRLPATLVFDYPTPVVLAEQLRGELLGVSGEVPAAVAAAASAEPVAIVAMGCRYPGGADSPEQLWELVLAGRDAVTGLPEDRGWDVAGLYDPDPDHEGTSYAREGGFVVGAGDFDAGFFGISPREALAMDPQQRLLLEVAWEVLERAGIDPVSLRGSATGVFAGAAYSRYSDSLAEGTGGSEGYVLTGTATSVISGRVSYALGLEGPAVTVDTACSSSLVALHLACAALRSGECSLALAGGVMVMVTPGAFVEFSRQRGLAADGRCKAFSAAADGIGWSEGAGMVLLERLSDAQRNGHPVLAVIRGSAINQDGASNGLTAPNGPSQQRVIRAALAAAQVPADEVDAVEAHGTGTRLGDPIEAQALLATYGQGRPEDRPLWLGSVKSNIGHTQTAAGIAGVIKTVLALRHGVLPRTLHVDEPSPHIDWSAGAVRLLTEPVAWPETGHPRRAGVSAFGISGTNVHAILEEAPAGDHAMTGSGDGVLAGPVLAGAVPWVVSGRSAVALRAQAGVLREWVAGRPGMDVRDAGWSLAVSRSVFEHRAVITGGDREELLAGLAAVAAGEPAAGVVSGVAGRAGQTAFVFPGQGGQWAGMGRELAAVSPVFAERLAECGAALAPFVDWSLEDVVAGVPGAPGLDRVDVVQPLLWAVMVSLAAVWEAAGVSPDAVVGHSQGEIAAACVAGILSLEDGARVVALRSQALRRLAGRGAMASVAEPASVVRERLAGWGERVSVAAVNGPAATVVSGDPEAVAELVAACQGDGVPGAGAAGRLRLARRAGRGDPRGDPGRAGRDHGPARADPDDLRDDGGAPGGSRGRRAVLVRQPACAGGVQPGGPGAGGLRARGVRRGVAAPGADRGGDRDAGGGRDGRRGGDGDAAPRGRRTVAAAGLAGRGARGRGEGRLGGGDRRRGAGGPAHVRVPASAVLAAAGGGGGAG